MIRPENADSVLARAGWLTRPETQRLLNLLDGSTGRTRAVGGAVRDTLLGMSESRTDVDFATELLPDEVMSRAERAGYGVHPTGIEHGTVTVTMDGIAVEVTTLREDVDTDGRHAVVRFGTDWKRDAERRDFTLNALYAGMDGRLFDPVGGLSDCLARRVRFIGDPARRIAEDRLRVLRFFRFSASHGNETLDAEGLNACRNAAGSLDHLAPERVGMEIRKMLALRRIAVTLGAMRHAGVLQLSETAITLQNRYERTAGRPAPGARMALLLSELDVEALKARWRLSNEEIREAAAILSAARLLMDFRTYEAAYRHPAALSEGLDVAAALANWGEAGKLAVMAKLEGLDVPRFPVSGADLLAHGMIPGRALGQELERLEQVWIASGFALGREDLLKLVVR